MSPADNQPIADRLRSDCRAYHEAPAAARGSP
jgi:hypothetical protein